MKDSEIDLYTTKIFEMSSASFAWVLSYMRRKCSSSFKLYIIYSFRTHWHVTKFCIKIYLLTFRRNVSFNLIFVLIARDISRGQWDENWFILVELIWNLKQLRILYYILKNLIMIDKQPITYYISCIILGHYGTDIFGLAVKSSRFKIEKKNCIILWCAFATSYSFVFLVFKSTEGAASRLDPFFIKLFLARVQTDVRDQRGFFLSSRQQFSVINRRCDAYC